MRVKRRLSCIIATDIHRNESIRKMTQDLLFNRKQLVTKVLNNTYVLGENDCYVSQGIV